MQRTDSPNARRITGTCSDKRPAITGVKGSSINGNVKPSSLHSTALKRSRPRQSTNRTPAIHNIDAVVRWIPVMGHPCFELGFIEDINVPHEPVNMRYPYPIRNRETKNIVRITPQYFEDYIKIVLDHQTCNLHRIYLTTLQPIYAAGMVVDHIDRDTHNNLMSNLRWTTISENNKNKGTRHKYFRTLDASELPSGLVEVEGTNALLDPEELLVYTPIGKKGSVKEYREFDAALNTVEVYIRPNGEVKIGYNPKIARTSGTAAHPSERAADRLYVSASQVLYKARVPYDTIQRIKERRRLLKSPEYAAKIKRLIEQKTFIKGDTDRKGFIIDFSEVESDMENR